MTPSWESSPLVWEILLVSTVLLPVVFVVTGGMSGAEKAVAAVCLLAVLPLYLLLGRPAIMADDPRRGTVYVVALVVLYGCAASTASISTFALFGLCPQCFVVYSARTAMIPVVLLSVAHIPRHLLLNGPGRYEFLTVTATAILFSMAFGMWSERVTALSAERAALIGELVESRAEVARLSAERGAAAERERLAGEIHDTLAQGFTSIVMLLQQPDERRIGLAVRTARENLAEARALVAALGPAPLDGSTLEEALGRMVSRFGEELAVAASFEVTGQARPMWTGAEVVLLRAAQEALANVRRHAHASAVTVTLVHLPSATRLTVRDNGVGLGSFGEGYGLRGMRVRAEQVGGSLTLTAADGGGTVLEITVPVSPGGGQTRS
ncbi:sensor histidine kinase [Streptosporangium saharense]|uniref:Signal transduction histidine kinase n=1 Tax=Streptosporangium saharense TaxID=1706840 RepID=A0A7W7VLM3_9ACTN|nr:sensor histidine kinase [Streptosporangium saharense]MBB4914564.1 signal transduction histidine kinase [Streptosporangium saharense]